MKKLLFVEVIVMTAFLFAVLSLASTARAYHPVPATNQPATLEITQLQE